MAKLQRPVVMDKLSSSVNGVVGFRMTFQVSALVFQINIVDGGDTTPNSWQIAW